jgi:hypothetical protein
MEKIKVARGGVRGVPVRPRRLAGQLAAPRDSRYFPHIFSIFAMNAGPKDARKIR